MVATEAVQRLTLLYRWSYELAGHVTRLLTLAQWLRHPSLARTAMAPGWSNGTNLCLNDPLQRPQRNGQHCPTLARPAAPTAAHRYERTPSALPRATSSSAVGPCHRSICKNHRHRGGVRPLVPPSLPSSQPLTLEPYSPANSLPERGTSPHIPGTCISAMLSAAGGRGKGLRTTGGHTYVRSRICRWSFSQSVASVSCFPGSSPGREKVPSLPRRYRAMGRTCIQTTHSPPVAGLLSPLSPRPLARHSARRSAPHTLSLAIYGSGHFVHDGRAAADIAAGGAPIPVEEPLDRGSAPARPDRVSRSVTRGIISLKTA